MQFGQLATHGRRPVTQYPGHRGEAGREPGIALIDDQASRDIHEALQPGFPGAGLLRREAGEGETVGRESGDRQGGEHGRSSGDGDHIDIAGNRLTRQLEPRIGHQGRAGIGDQRDHRPVGQGVENARPDHLPNMIMIGLQLRPYAMGVEEAAGDPCILGKDPIRRAQHIQCAQGDIPQIPDRCRHQVKPGGQRLPRDAVAASFALNFTG